jgi:Protein of unknown function (DUF3631)
MQNEKKTITVSVPSLLLDNKIIETIITEGGHKFCVFEDGEFELLGEIEVKGIRYIPISHTSSLIRSGILSFQEAPIQFETPDALHTKIKDHISKYLTLDPDFSNLLACYIMLTWVYDAFSELPYLRFQGDYGSGKTRALLVSGALCFKSFNAGGASTVSPIFHILDKYQGTLVLDEADFRFSDEKSEIVKILNNGNARGFPVLRSQMNQKKEFEPRAFQVYGPKLIAMRGSYQDVALESRFLTTFMGKGKRASHIPTQLPEQIKNEVEDLKRKLLMYRFTFLHKVNSIQVEMMGLTDRARQIILPLLAIAPNEQIKNSILTVSRCSLEGLSFEGAFSFEAEILKAIQFVQNEEKQLSVSEILRALRMQTEREFDKSLTASLVGRTLRNRLGLKLYKTRGIVTVHPLQDELIQKLRGHYGLD